MEAIVLLVELVVLFLFGSMIPANHDIKFFR